MKVIFFLLFLWTSTLVSCSEKKNTPNQVDDERFINFYADYLVLQEESKNFNLDSLTQHKRLDSLYHAYHYNKEQVATITAEYNKDAMLWKELYEKVVKRLETMQSISQSVKK